jgi:hypothetical protein
VAERSSRMGGIAESLWVSGRVFYTLVDETVIIKAGGETLFSMLCILVNGKGSRSAAFWRAGHKLSLWEVCRACRQAAFWSCRGVALSRMKSSDVL